MGSGSKVELFERIRLDRAQDAKVSIRELARRHGVHRRDIRAALGSAVPAPRKPPERVSRKLGEYHGLIDSWLVGDRDIHRKQRHTARRVWQRLVEEHGAQVSERAVAYHVSARRRALGFTSEGFVPQQHEPGIEAEVDWGHANVILAGVPTLVNIFLMRASYSGASYVQAFLHETQQAFLEAHSEAFDYFGGVFQAIWYDNLTSAVRKVLKGRERIATERFAQYRSHYEYVSDFTLAGLRGAHEKGGVESEVGRFRRRRKVQARVHARTVEVYVERKLIAIHERLGGRHGHQAQLDHYLEILAHKPGALAGSKALAQERERGLWPAAYDQLWREIAERHGRSHAARQLVDVLMLCRQVGPERVQQAVRQVLASGAYDGQAVALLAHREARPQTPDLADLSAQLQVVGTAVPDLSFYDNLLSQPGDQ